MAEKIAENQPFICVDIYENNNSMLFGELTFSPAVGMGQFELDGWDKEIGFYMNKQ